MTVDDSQLSSSNIHLKVAFAIWDLDCARRWKKLCDGLMVIAFPATEVLVGVWLCLWASVRLSVWAGSK